MNLSLVTNIGAARINKLQQSAPVKRTGLQQDTCQFSTKPKQEEKEQFDLNSAMTELKNAKTFNGKLKFKEDKIAELETILQETPEKWQAIQTLSKEPKMISALIMEFAERDVDTLNSVADLTARKDEKGEPQFSPLAIKRFANMLDGKDLAKVGTLAQTRLDADDMVKIAKDNRITNLNKLVKKVNGFVNQTEDVRRVSFDKDEFSDSGYVIRLDLDGRGSKLLLLDENLDDRAVEQVEITSDKQGNTLQIKKSRDYKNNTTSKITSRVDKSAPQPVVTEERKYTKDSSGRILKQEVYQLSDVNGVPNITQIFADGTQKVISSGTVDEKTGKTIVQKDMVSLDGTRTNYYYEDTPDGDMVSSYKITDKNGKVLLNNNLTFKQIGENTYLSTENDKKYQINISDSNITVTNLNNDEVTTISLNEETDGNREKLMQSLKHMPAEELISMQRTTDKVIGIDNICESTFAAKTKTIKSGDNLFTILHEIGHAKDYEHVDVTNKETLMNSIYSNPEVNKVFNEEKTAFTKQFPLAQRDHISYFIKNSEYNDGLQEVIAETNALLNTRNTKDIFAIRGQYLQQYFPRTIVLLSQLLD